uniref:Uncharacterized protein n=1 Tax=Acrobeloides nanus TaxID=290746 RepID=A0A914DZV9_9BILA
MKFFHFLALLVFIFVNEVNGKEASDDLLIEAFLGNKKSNISESTDLKLQRTYYCAEYCVSSNCQETLETKCFDIEGSFLIKKEVSSKVTLHWTDKILLLLVLFGNILMCKRRRGHYTVNQVVNETDSFYTSDYDHYVYDRHMYPKLTPYKKGGKKMFMAYDEDLKFIY